MKELICLLRGRNESLIAKDTLDHFSEFTDGTYFYDDASEYNTLEICKNHKSVLGYTSNSKWDPNQTLVQGKQRSDLLEYAKFRHPDAMFLYADFDERIEFDFDEWDGKSAVVMRLFDARMIKQDQKPYLSGKLKGFRKYFDPEVRHIPFIFSAKSKYIGVACERYPSIEGQEVVHSGFVEHYGKAISKKHWQDTCAYYAKYLPVYAEKWEKRKKESGVVSKEGLLTWEECKAMQAKAL